MIYAYLRQMPESNHLSKQLQSIFSFALIHGLHIDKEVVEHSSKNRAIEDRQQLEDFIHSLERGDGMVIETLSVLSDCVVELVKLINCTLSREITVYVADTKTVITKETPLVEMFPFLNDLREARKAKTGQIGRPKGSKSSSKFDKLQVQIITFLKEGLSVSAIARELDVSRSSLKDYVESRGIKELVRGAWIEINRPKEDLALGNDLLICPFEKVQEEN
ncbi:MAG: Resolvase/invertase-type recombinase catalytic protein [Campylobacterota bacterium]|nr:Resolvase/invertase-type recombinase catalytic protein [Campylobacterota bacterium]